MRIVFAGTPEFAAQALSALLQAGDAVPLVLTQPDRAAGRGLQPKASPVKALAEAQGLPIWQPESLRHPEAIERLRAVAPDVLVVAAYGLILPQAVLSLPPLGCVNIHASLLPRWRGAAPIQRAIEAGDQETGITLMQMDAGLDTGGILARYPLPIRADDTAGTLHDRLAALGAAVIADFLPRLPTTQARAQDDALATYAAKLSKQAAGLDWTAAATLLERRVRAFNPTPGAHTLLDGAPLKVWSARVAAGTGDPGELIEATSGGLRVACGEGALDLLEVQRAGGRRMLVAEFLAGHTLHRGQKLG